MSDRIFRLALRAVPAQIRKSNGPAILGMAEDMIDSGRSGAVKEARGIAGYGVRKRLMLNRDWLRALPFGEGLRLLALPIAILQLVILLLTARSFDLLALEFAWPGKWLLVALALSAAAATGALMRNRIVLGVSAFALLALFLLDTYGSGGSMLHGTSHTRDIAFSMFDLGTQRVLAPAALIMIPSTLLIAISSLTDWSKDRAASQGPVRGVAAGLLLASQTPLLGLLLAFSLVNSGFGGDWPVAIAIVATLAVLLSPLVAAFVLVRVTAGPRRLL
ncbi:MAG: hypothetical protein JHD02_07570 [Thermoleophilaceae bacterium]|nr:hypothetical protein [Thermoleophilaceae bacterium]